MGRWTGLGPGRHVLHTKRFIRIPGKLCRRGCGGGLTGTRRSFFVAPLRARPPLLLLCPQSTAAPFQWVMEVRSATGQRVVVATHGLPEYHLRRNGAVAVTLLRATSRLRDWGSFDVPSGLGPAWVTQEYALLVHEGPVGAEGLEAVDNFGLEMVGVPVQRYGVGLRWAARVPIALDCRGSSRLRDRSTQLSGPQHFAGAPVGPSPLGAHRHRATSSPGAAGACGWACVRGREAAWAGGGGSGLRLS